MTTLPTTPNASATILPTAQPLAPQTSSSRGLWGRLRDFGSRDHQPHGFTTDAFVAHDLGVADPFPVVQISFPANLARLVAFLRFLLSFYWVLLPVVAQYLAPLLGVLVLILLPTAKLLQHNFAIGNGTIVWIWLKLGVLMRVGVLHCFSVTSRGSRVDSILGKFSCWSFWTTYFIFCDQLSRFMQNYLAAWRQQHHCEVAVFFDNKHESFLRIPCPPPQTAGVDSLDDEYLLRHLHLFYNISKIQEGLIAALIPKTLVRVDVIELNHDRFAGAFESTLGLGFDGYRQVARLEHPDMVTNQRHLIQDLQTKNVLRISNAVGGGPSPSPPPVIPPQRALNFVSGWDASAASFIILTPTVLSIMVTVIWPAVAVQKYGADAQSSVQTGTAVASYIITASALLIALEAWYDSIINAKR